MHPFHRISQLVRAQRGSKIAFIFGIRTGTFFFRSRSGLVVRGSLTTGSAQVGVMGDGLSKVNDTEYEIPAGVPSMPVGILLLLLLLGTSK
jgi:hypothetical protein